MLNGSVMKRRCREESGSQKCGLLPKKKAVSRLGRVLDHNKANTCVSACFGKLTSFQQRVENPAKMGQKTGPKKSLARLEVEG